jgi:hypothetical protein
MLKAKAKAAATAAAQRRKGKFHTLSRIRMSVRVLTFRTSYSNYFEHSRLPCSRSNHHSTVSTNLDLSAAAAAQAQQEAAAQQAQAAATGVGISSTRSGRGIRPNVTRE